MSEGLIPSLEVQHRSHEGSDIIRDGMVSFSIDVGKIPSTPSVMKSSTL